MRADEIDKRRQLPLGALRVGFFDGDVEQRSRISRRRGSQAHGVFGLSVSLYLKGTSVYLYHGIERFCCFVRRSAALDSIRSAPVGDELEQSIQLVFRREFDFDSPT